MPVNLPQTTEIAIIGGGIMGASLAWHLARRGCRDVTLFERSVIAGGASGRTGALLRQHYSNRPEATLVHASHEIYAHWPEVVGGDCGFVACGLVVPIATGPGGEGNRALLEQNVAMQRSVGIDTRVITAAELHELEPEARVDDFAVAAFEPTSGYVDAIAATRSMAQAAADCGVYIRENCPVEGIAISGDRVTGLHTGAGLVATQTVVCAAGPWSVKLLAGIGLDVPIQPIRVQIAILQRPLSFSRPHFVYVDPVAGVFCRPDGPGQSLAGVAGGDQHDPANPDDFDERNDPGYPAAAIAAMTRRFPSMANARYLHGHAGLYDMTPDAHPILGPAGPDGLYLMAGFSGAGFKKGPAVGQVMAELLLDGQGSLVDLTPFRLDRFASDAWRRPWSDTEYTLTSDFGHTF